MRPARPTAAGEIGGAFGDLGTLLPILLGAVAVAGMSAGGAAALNIAHAYPDLYAAVGVHSGLAAGCARDLGSALMAMQVGAPGLGTGPSFGAPVTGKRIPTIVFHGSDDNTVSVRNADQILAQAEASGLTAIAESFEGLDARFGGRPFTRTRFAEGDVPDDAPESALMLGCDSVLEFEGRTLGKPVDAGDAAIVASVGVTGDRDRSGDDRSALIGSEDVGVERDRGQRQPVTGPGFAGVRFGGQQPVGGGLEVVVRRRVLDGDALDPFDATSADVAGHHHAHRAAV